MLVTVNALEFLRLPEIAKKLVNFTHTLNTFSCIFRNKFRGEGARVFCKVKDLFWGEIVLWKLRFL